MQIALPYYCKIEFGALSKDSITEKNSAIAADGKNYHTMLMAVLYSVCLKRVLNALDSTNISSVGIPAYESFSLSKNRFLLRAILWICRYVEAI